MSHVVIIGNGIAGITAARHIRKFSDNRITVISAENEYFFSRPALMYVYMGHMKFEHTQPYENSFWKKNRIELKQAYINIVDFKSKKLISAEGEEIVYDKLILATGSVTHFRGWKGQDLNGVQGLVAKQDLELLNNNSENLNHAVIVGGGLIGIELAEMLHTRNIEVTMLIRESHFWGSVLPIEEGKLISNHIEKRGINLVFETELAEIIPDSDNRVKSIKTTTGKHIDCQWVGIATGVKPNISFLKNTALETDLGILVNRNLATNIPDVYAIGDCAQQCEPIGHRKSVEAVWYTGRIMGETVAQTICGNPTAYNPSNWFNSAKFFDIEYQTYGWVFSKKKEGYSDFYWQDAKNERALHFQYETNSKKFIGINAFGIRLRHEIVDAWLTEKLPIEKVILQLQKANFDKEFSKKYLKKVQQAFQQSKFQKNLVDE
ncbi:NAD(P)/FAD-dependent oxidoreductase [Mesonia aestuariivivens]|uniref:NAD(P)/FAD-dependent oxidoreductase n=1 Tax=Mesonia aestuariivivens TaxID=2796128 RepID=A0ABS6VZR6_9FLAO|nr:NAD(P)/FAD-dependent oxidoreductase [Mesonia aestuariivivens]MBW2960994.1 NAD(P)/FAD-dependent oxidoreductase [Mesonia aestuariivivens]